MKLPNAARKRKEENWKLPAKADAKVSADARVEADAPASLYLLYLLPFAYFLSNYVVKNRWSDRGIQWRDILSFLDAIDTSFKQQRVNCIERARPCLRGMRWVL